MEASAQKTIYQIPFSTSPAASIGKKWLIKSDYPDSLSRYVAVGFFIFGLQFPKGETFRKGLPLFR